MNQAQRPARAHTADNDRPYRGRRMTWQEFWQMRPDRKPANDNVERKSAPIETQANSVYLTINRR